MLHLLRLNFLDRICTAYTIHTNRATYVQPMPPVIVDDLRTECCNMPAAI